jgi:hypothetical protein
VDEKLNSSLFFWFFPAAVSLCCSFQTAWSVPVLLAVINCFDLAS